MNHSKISFSVLLILTLTIVSLEAKAKVRIIDDSNFDQFSKDNSYWIIQISQSQCNECQTHEKQLLQTADLLEGVCKIGKVDAKFLKGMKIQRNPTYVFLRSDNIGQNVQYKEAKINKVSIAKFCLQQIEKAIKKRHKTLFSSDKKNREHSKQQNSSSKKYDSTKMIDLTDQQFQKAVLQSSDAWFVLFYSPNCGHCRSLQPQYNKLPSMMGKKVNIARIDATKHSKMAQKYQIKGYPTMLLFEADQKEKQIPYQGQRTAEDIKTWLNTKNLSQVKKQLLEMTKKTYEQTCNRNIVCLVFILDSKTEKSKLKFIKPLLQQITDKPIEFLFTERIPTLQSSLMIQDRSCPKMFATWEGINSYRIYNGGNTQQELREFISHLMERRKWMKFQQKSSHLLFGSASSEL